MSRLFSSGIATPMLSIAAVLSAGAAQADLTAADVWADWQGYLASSGYEVTATETQSGNTLGITDVTLTMELPEDEGSMTAVLGALDFVENGDGTVSVLLPPTMPMNFTIVAPDEGDVSVDLEYTMSGFNMIAAGIPADLKYSYNADEIGLNVSSVEVEGETIDLGEVSFSLTGVVGETEMQVGDLRNSIQQLRSDALTYTIDITDPDEGGTVFMQSELSGLDVIATGAVPTEIDMTDIAAAIAAGFGADARFGFAGGKTEIRIEDSEQTVNVETSSEGGVYNFALSEGGLTYALGVAGMKLFIQGGEIPLPVELAFGEAGFNLTMPLSQSDEEQDFAFGVNLGDFIMSDLIWGMFDPSAQLPRDPATLALDLTGTAKLFFDLFDPEQMSAVETEGVMPGELNSVSLNDLRLSLAGAELSGKGAFIFDNDDLETFEGMPAPEGAVDLSLVGGNGLLDKLIGMGLVPEDEAMGVRMMMGLFAVPGEGEDTLNSTIEVMPDGQVLANGQRLR